MQVAEWARPGLRGRERERNKGRSAILIAISVIVLASNTGPVSAAAPGSSPRELLPCPRRLGDVRLPGFEDRAGLHGRRLRHGIRRRVRQRATLHRAGDPGRQLRVSRRIVVDVHPQRLPGCLERLPAPRSLLRTAARCGDRVPPRPSRRVSPIASPCGAMTSVSSSRRAVRTCLASCRARRRRSIDSPRISTRSSRG